MNWSPSGLRRLLCLTSPLIACLISQGNAATVIVTGSTTAVSHNAQPFFSDFGYASTTTYGYARNFGNGSGSFFSWADGKVGTTFYQNNDVTPGVDVAFPSTFIPNNSELFITTGNGAVFGQDNWVAFSNGTNKGWISFTLDNSGFITTMNYFLSDSARPSGMLLSDAIAHRTGTNPVLFAPVPEFSSGIAAAGLCFVGALSYRRRRPLAAFK